MLFSDIEQSTLLLTRLGPAYEGALDACRAAQRAAWVRFGGVEMGTEGDSFFVVFSSAEDATAAAAQAQISLVSYGWPAGEQVRVRMGIHTGTPRVHDKGYVGIDVHRAARIAAAAHGGQVVISDATAKLVTQHLPADVSLRDLGGHRLKDLNLPEHLYQLVIAGTRSDFPPLKSVGTISSLPVPGSPLLGRRPELTDLSALLLDPGVRLVTLTGAGGAGKTRLAIATAQKVATRFPDGVYFVPLAAITNAENLWSSIWEALNLPMDGRSPEAFCAHMAGRHALLVLDNVEQIQGADDAVATLLQQASDLAILATSRRPLHLAHEHQYMVGPLQLPFADTPEEAAKSPAVQLFIDRARAVRASFALDAEDAAEVVAICRHLDGLPLAIELAAARSKLLGPRALLSRLDQVLDLRGTGTDRPTRQRALRETIEWSYRLLPPAQQAVFRRMGVFAGGAGLDALSPVCSDGTVEAMDPIDLVEDLVDASLVMATEDDDGEPRFHMLELVRAFALEALARSGELEGARRAHAAHFAGVAERLDWTVLWATREDRMRGNRLFELELNNFREALAWATSTTSQPAGLELATTDRTELGLALLARTASEIWQEFDPTECRHWLEVILSVPNPEPSIDRGTCLYSYADVLAAQANPSRALEMAERSVKMLRALDDRGELAWALTTMADLAARSGDLGTSRRMWDEVRAIGQDLGNSFIAGRALRGLGELKADEGSYNAALQLLSEAHQSFEEGGWHYLPNLDFYIAGVLRKIGNAEQAHQLMSVELQQEARAFTPLNLLLHCESYAAALADAGFPLFTPLLLAACDTESRRLGYRRLPREDRVVADARTAAEAALTPTEWAEVYARGQGMTVVDAVNEALATTAGLQI